MASNLLKFTPHSLKATNPSIPILPLPRTLTFTTNGKQQNYLHHSHLHFFPQILPHKLKISPLSIKSSLSSPTPPTSKQEAIFQAKHCLSAALSKPLNNPKLAGKIKKTKQPRYRLEIPVIDDSPISLSQLAFEVFADLPVKRKGPPVKFLILWPNRALTEAAIEVFHSHSSIHVEVEHMDISLVNNEYNRNLNSADVTVFFAPEFSQLEDMKTVTDSLYSKPVVVFNPRWAFEEESDLKEMGSFVASFEVVYSFVGLEVRGVLSKKKGVIFKCARDGVLSGEKWTVFVEEEEGNLKVVSTFRARPSIGEVENVLYNLMAVNSPITKSAKFLRELVTNVTGKK